MCELVFTTLVKGTHMSNLLVNSLHELFQTLEVQTEFLDQLTPSFFKVCIK